MSAIHRSHLRRWFGAGALLAVGLPLAAQQPTPLPMNPMPITSPQPPATNKEAPAPIVISPTNPVDPSKLADKLVNFEMRDKPWKNVLEWLCNETGMPIIANAIPTGSFTFYGNPKQTYRIPQIIDFLNDALTEKKFVIIRRQAVISVVPADQQIDPAYVPRITVDQLKNYGSTEIVQVIVQLKTTNADDLAPEVAKMMGPFKEVTPLLRSNQLLLQDSAVTLQRVVDTIKQMEENETGQTESYSHKCEYIKAREAERILKELLGDPVALLRALQAGQPQGQPGRPNDPNQQKAAPNVQLPKLRPHYISVDDRLGVVLVSGSADKIAQARSIIKNVDVPQYPGQRAAVPAPPILKNYPTAAGAADSIAKTLKEIYKTNTAIRIESVGGSAIMVLAGGDDQIDIARLVAGGDIQSSETAIITITSLDVDKTALTLKGMFQDAKTLSGPYIEADTGRGAIIIKGTPAQVADVKAFVKLSEGDAGTSPNMRIISLDRGNAAALAAEIERLMNQTRRNPVKIINPNAEPTPPPAPPLNPKSVPQSGNGGGLDQPAQLVDPKTQPGTGEPVTISIIGNRIVITSKDPAAVQMASELARMIISAPAGEGEFEIIKLKNTNATDAARIIDEMYNGPRTTGGGQQQIGFPFGGSFGGGRFGGNQNQPAASTAPTTAKVRVIADPSSNSLLVKASPVDLLSIKKYLKDGIDGGPAEGAAQKTYVIGPLKAARAEEIAEAVRDVYRDSLSSNSTQVGRGGGGGFPFGGGQPAQKLTDANGNPRPPALTVGVNEPTNTILVKCSESMYKEVKTLIDDLDSIARGSPRTIKIVSVKGIDPTQLQQAIDALQAPNGTTNNNNRNNFGNFGGGFGGGNRIGGGGGNRGGGGGNRGGGNRGGGRMNRAPDREPGGPDFFDAGVKDDRQPASEDAANFSMLYDPQAAGYSGEEQRQPPGRPNQPGSSADIRAPLETVDVQALEQLGVVILRTQTQADMEELEKLIKYLQEHAEKTEVQITLVPLKQGDATHISSTLNQVFSRVIIGPTGNTALPLADQRQQAPQRSSNQFFGTSVSQTDAVGSILLLPFPRFNAIIVGAPKSRFEYVVAEINKLDQANAPGAGAFYFPLRKAPAVRVANQIRSFYATRYSNETDVTNQIRITHDDASNTVIVQASPADLAEIRSMIERIDSMVSSAVNELRIIQLRNALPEELANTLMSAITQGVVAPSTAPATTGTQNQFNPFTGGQQPQRPGGVQPAVTANTTKTTSLRFYSQPGPGGTVESGLLEDVHITPEARSNSLLISAPPKTMDLIMALINRLDVVSSARAEMKIFTLKKGDANQTAILLQQFFLGQQAARPATAAPGAPGQAALAATQAGSRPLLSLSNQPSDGATLVDLKISVDDRSNSIIVAGSRNDLQVIEAIISKMEDATVQTRRNEVYKLRNAAAADVQTAIQALMTQSMQVLVNANQSSNYQQILRNVVIVAEPISNSLLISSSPEYFEEVMRLIAQIDTMPPQVVIQVLIAEVRLDNDEEFGIELGLQSPILFQRSVLPSGVTVNNSAAIPGFNFNATPLPALGNSTLTGPGTPVPRSNSPGIVGFQGVGNLGVGRTSPTLGASGLVLSAASDTFTMLIRALKMQGRLDVLSRPQIMTLDNQTAALLIGQNVPYLSGSNVTATGVVTSSIDRRDVGVLLRVTPRITPDGKVLMRVFPEVSSVDPVPVALGNGQIGTSFNTQEIETTVAASDNETVIIGGLIQTADLKQENKVPGLGDLPYVGAAFRYRTQSRQKKELLVILTPHIVRSQEDMARVLAEESRRMDWIAGDVCRVHGPGGLENVLPQQTNNNGCALPMLNGPSGSAPNCVPMISPQPGEPIVVPSYLPSQPIRPAGGIPPSPPGSPVLPATYDTAPPPAAPLPPPTKDKGKDSRPWVFQRG